jgi:hypothetical protein
MREKRVVNDFFPVTSFVSSTTTTTHSLVLFSQNVPSQSSILAGSTFYPPPVVPSPSAAANIPSSPSFSASQAPSYPQIPHPATTPAIPSGPSLVSSARRPIGAVGNGNNIQSSAHPLQQSVPAPRKLERSNSKPMPVRNQPAGQLPDYG